MKHNSRPLTANREKANYVTALENTAVNVFKGIKP